MLALRLPKDLEDRLDAMAKKTGRTKSFYARQAIIEKLDDLEDYFLAKKRLKVPGERYTVEKIEAEPAASFRKTTPDQFSPSSPT